MGVDGSRTQDSRERPCGGHRHFLPAISSFRALGVGTRPCAHSSGGGDLASILGFMMLSTSADVTNFILKAYFYIKRRS